jgi:hypothetical protein
MVSWLCQEKPTQSSTSQNGSLGSLGLSMRQVREVCTRTPSLVPQEHCGLGAQTIRHPSQLPLVRQGWFLHRLSQEE